MSPLELYHYVAQLLEAMPAYVDGEPEVREHQSWQAKALAALELDGIASMRDATEFRHYMEMARRGFRSKSGDRLRQSLSNLLARCELRLPPEQRGAFIAVGDNFSAFATLTAVISEAKKDLFVVDPYLSHEAINRFIVAAPQGIAIRLLRDGEGRQQPHTPALVAAMDAWNTQYADRPLEIRSAPARSLHDRAIFIDRASAFTVSQSLKDIAARSPALVHRVAPELVGEKTAAYEDIWNNSLRIQ
ncbi:hypothetical protein [Stenotrophomonas sp. YIM B13575]|uniref:hypothetical protein n=1 Tax=Stenotrophomonas sp. YIM B13575 TaxID=3366314 RepID=UPI0036A166F8